MQNETLTATPQIRKQLVLALAKVQGAIQNPKKDTDNPFFKSKYADLASVWDSVRGLLAANDLAFVQMPTTDGKKVSIAGLLLHASGESLESTITAEAKDAMPQSIGSCITYLRRYQLSSILGIAAEDDDGNAAQGQEKPKSKAQERPTFANGKPFEQHQAEQAAALPLKPPPVPLKDLGDFESLVLSCNVAGTGGPKDKPWTRYEVLTEKHPEHRLVTFDLAIYDEARTAVTMREPVMVKTELTPKGIKVIGFGPVEVSAVA